ncbi:hypothetical protein QFC21_006134 [Naganishia friedmannii]|uniref:Uncharacterized protein n=1 Tax=Naganishia friedmannii TaxID=89922 RepID=A0ACC2V4K6_9TREE|nr:hypothetical protein QFC21_006134 [Naganishia friedmannii]
MSGSRLDRDLVDVSGGKRKDENAEMHGTMDASVISHDDRIDTFSKSTTGASPATTISLSMARTNSVTVQFESLVQEESTQPVLEEYHHREDQNTKVRKDDTKEQQAIEDKKSPGALRNEKEEKQAVKAHPEHQATSDSVSRASSRHAAIAGLPLRPSIETVERANLSLPELSGNSAATLAFPTTHHANPQVCVAEVAPSAFSLLLRTADMVKDTHAIRYPIKISAPTSALNDFTDTTRIRYERKFLLQFATVCKGEVSVEIPLDILGIDPRNPPKIVRMGRGGEQRSGSRGQTRGRDGPRSIADRGMGHSGGRKPFDGNVGGTYRSGLGSLVRPARPSAEQPTRLNDRSGERLDAAFGAWRSPRDGMHEDRRDKEEQQHLPDIHSEHIMTASAATVPRSTRDTEKQLRDPPDDDYDFAERQIRALLGSITDDNFDAVSSQILQWANKFTTETDGQTLRLVIQLVFEKAKDGPMTRPICAKLCRRMWQDISPDVHDYRRTNEDGRFLTSGLLFRKYLLNRCQEDFEKGWKQKADASAAAKEKAVDNQLKLAAQDAATEPSKEAEESESSNKYYAAQTSRQQRIGLVQFVGEFFKLEMLSTRVIHACIVKLLANVVDPDEEDVESLCQLLTTVGAKLEAQPKMSQQVGLYMQRMDDLRNSEHLSLRIRFMVQLCECSQGCHKSSKQPLARSEREGRWTLTSSGHRSSSYRATKPTGTAIPSLTSCSYNTILMNVHTWKAQGGTAHAPASALIPNVQVCNETSALSAVKSIFASDTPVGHQSSAPAVLVLHFQPISDIDAPHKACEAASVVLSDDPAIRTPVVNVLCSNATYRETKQAYDHLGSNVNVWPLAFNREDIDVQSLIALLGNDEDPAPGYMELVRIILDDLGNSYTYDRFLEAAKTHVVPDSVQGQRLAKRSSERTIWISRFLHRKSVQRADNGISDDNPPHVSKSFMPGSLTIVDLCIPDPRLGHLPSPLSALVLHFGESGSTMKPCEAAFVGLSDDPAVEVPTVNVFCSPSAYFKTKELYDRLGGSVKVWPLYFTEDDIDAQSLLALMAVDENGSMPLYMHVVMSILSDLGSTYTFTKFLSAIKQAKFDPLQQRSLEQRLTLLQTFLSVKVGQQIHSMKTKQRVAQPEEKFIAGGLTIVDLTDPFISPGTACSLFEIVLKLFNRADVGTGKVVVLDEAHKYLSEVGKSQTEGSRRLTERMLSFTRQQRHLAMRIIISTTGWWSHLGKHVATELSEETFDKVVTLKTGHCLVFSPTALIAKPETPIVQALGNLSLQEFGTGFLDSWSLPIKPAENVNGLKASEPRKKGRPGSWDPNAPAVADTDATGCGQSEDLPKDASGATEAVTDAKEWKPESSPSGWGGDDAPVSARPSRPISQEVLSFKLSDSGLVTPADSLNVLTPIEANDGEKNALTLEIKEKEESDKPGDKLRKTEHLGRGYLTVKTRRRVTVDGGRSLLATESTAAKKQGKSASYIPSLIGLTFCAM